MALIAGCLLAHTARPAAAAGAVGQTVTLSVTVDGTAPFSYQWYKDGVSLAGATGRTYVIIGAQSADAGSYHVVVSNAAGSATSDDAVLTVTPAADVPGFTTQSGSPVAAGDSVTFVAALSGSRYQWQRQPAGSSSWADLNEGGSYTGVATAVLTVNAVDATMSGDQFRCIITGPAGSTTGNAVTLTVGATSFLLQYPTSIARDNAGNLYVADASSNTIQKVTTAGVVSTLAGATGAVGSQDGAGTGARFNQPTGVAVDAVGNVYVADAGNATVRKITPDGNVTTLAGSPTSRGSRDGTGSDALFSQPSGLAVDSVGTVYVTDAFNAIIRKITSDGTVNTLAGAAGSRGKTDGNGPAARFNFPNGVAVDATGNLYVADTYNATIRKISPDGTVIALAGSAGITGAADGVGANALFNQPIGVAVDAAGNVYVADTGNSTIRKITPDGAVATLAGTAGISGLADGTGDHALFNQPQGLVNDGAGNLFVTDAGNAAIRRVAPDATVTTMALTLPGNNSSPSSGTTPAPSSGNAPPPSSGSTPPSSSGNVPPASSGSTPAPSSGGTPPPSSGSDNPTSSGGGGGGGAIGGWFVAALFFLAAARHGADRRASNTTFAPSLRRKSAR